ncbi:MAG: hypothetical protein KKD86_18675 [Bacteroidetes bacterium]|nr:hypothetical protein [Bacteroidota bacterium]MBU1680851.1 hypothetical protein [Bacteroidota bacterium]
MKKLIITVLFFASIIIYAQEKDNTKSKVEEYISLLKKYSKNIKATKEDFKGKLKPEILETLPQNMLISLKVQERIDSLSDEEIINYAKLKADANEEAPFEVWRLKSENHYRIQRLLSERKAITEMRVSSLEGLFENRMKKTLPEIMINVLRIPYIFMGTIKTINISDDILKGDKNTPDLRMKKIIVTAIAEEILKGENKFQVGDEVEFYFYKNWNRSGLELEEGETYFISLLPTMNLKGDHLLSLVFFSEDKNAIFHIEDEILIDTKNYFGFGPQILWDDFKSKFQSKYIIK